MLLPVLDVLKSPNGISATSLFMIAPPLRFIAYPKAAVEVNEYLVSPVYFVIF